jgi:hypothetical protein
MQNAEHLQAEYLTPSPSAVHPRFVHVDEQRIKSPSIHPRPYIGRWMDERTRRVNGERQFFKKRTLKKEPIRSQPPSGHE